MRLTLRWPNDPSTSEKVASPSNPRAVFAFRFPNVSISQRGDISMNAIIYLVGLVVVVMFILSLIGLR
jgi:hypothetical protein